MMPFIEFTIGIAIGLGLGILIMIFIDVKQKKSSNDYMELEDFEDQVHESGFIDIPVHSMMQDNYHTNTLEPGKFKKRIQGFKNKNRFYR